MPKPLPRVPHVESPFVQRAELLTLVPQSMSTIDRLEAEGQFPKRIRLEPTNRVAWVRRKITSRRLMRSLSPARIEAGRPQRISPLIQITNSRRPARH